MLTEAAARLSMAKIYPDSRLYHKEGARVISALLGKGSLSEKEYYDLTGDDIGETLLKANVFAFHFSTRRVTFQSALIMRWCEENASLWEQAVTQKKS